MVAGDMLTDRKTCSGRVASAARALVDRQPLELGADSPRVNASPNQPAGPRGCARGNVHSAS